MPVTDDQVEAFRALLTGRSEEHARLVDRLGPVETRTGYSALIAAGFFEAVDRRFVKNDKIADEAEVIDFVAWLRSQNDEVADGLDPRIAERLIQHSLGRGTIADIDDSTVLSAQILILGGLIADTRPNEAEFESFLSEVRAVADDWIDKKD